MTILAWKINIIATKQVKNDLLGNHLETDIGAEGKELRSQWGIGW